MATFHSYVSHYQRVDRPCHSWPGLQTVRLDMHGLRRSGSVLKNTSIWRFPKMTTSPYMDGLFHGKSQLEVDGLGVPLFQENPIYGSGSEPWDLWLNPEIAGSI